MLARPAGRGDARLLAEASRARRKRRRIEMFARNLYRHGLLGRFIGLLHGVARLHGKKLDGLAGRQERRANSAPLFDQLIAPLFESAAIKLISKSPISLYALGIPPAQYDALVASGNGDAIAVLRERVERLACDFPIQDNYFAWQAFGRGYDLERREAVPAYLQAENYADTQGARRPGQRASRLAGGFSQDASRPSRSTAMCCWMRRTG